MAKDRVRPLFDVLSSNDSTNIRSVAERILAEIQVEVTALNRDAKLVRDLVARYGGPADGLSSVQRSAKVREAAMALVQRGQRELAAQDVIDYLEAEEQLSFDVKRPASMVGTVLSQMPEFTRLEQNKFKYEGRQDE